MSGFGTKVLGAIRRKSAKRLVCSAVLLVTAGAGGCAMWSSKIPRPAGKDCLRYEFVYQRAHLGNDQWGDLEFVSREFTAPTNPPHRYPEYTQCPAEAVPDSSLVRLWRQWHDKTERPYTRRDPQDPVALQALGPPRKIRQRMSDGEFHVSQVERYSVFFRGCDYWVAQRGKICVE